MPITQNDIINLMQSLRPRVMMKNKKIRVGNLGDGGYVLPECVMSCDSVLSIGIGHDVSFDLELANKGMTIYQFDHTVDDTKQHEKFIFEKKGWSTKNDDLFVDIEYMISKINNDGHQNPMIKFDIEGAELEILSTIDEKKLKTFRVITCELHWLDNLSNEDYFETFSTAVHKLTKYHCPIHFHVNNYGSLRLIQGVPIPDVIEVSFLRKDLDVFIGFSSEQIPGLLYYPNNPSAPDVLINLF